MSDQWSQVSQYHGDDHRDQERQQEAPLTPEVEQEVVDQQEGDPSVYDVSSSGGSNVGKYSDSDLRYIFRFVHKLSLAPLSERQSFLDALGLGNLDTARVVTALYPAEGRASNLFELYNLAEQLNPAGDPITYGQSIVRLMGALGDMDTDDLRALSKSIDAISEEYSPDVDLIRYTRRQTSEDVTKKIIAIIPAWSQEARQFLDWATDLLMIWPRKES